MAPPAQLANMLCPKLTIQDLYDRADSTSTGPDWPIYYTVSPYANVPPEIFSNMIRAGVPTTTSSPNNITFGFNLHRAPGNRKNRLVQASLIGAPSGLNAVLVIAATHSGDAAAHLNVVNVAGHSGISTSALLVPTNRVTYPPADVVSGDICGIEVYEESGVKTYVGFRYRFNGAIYVRKNLCAWTDSGAILPSGNRLPRHGTLNTAQKTAGPTVTYGPMWADYTYVDLDDRIPNVTFVQTAILKNGSTQSWPTSATWVTVAGVVADPAYPGTVAASNGATVIGNNAAANLVGSVPWTGALSGTRQHTARIVRVSDGAVIATGTTIAGTSGTALVATGSSGVPVVNGEVYQLQVNSNGASAGTIPANTASLAIT